MLFKYIIYYRHNREEKKTEQHKKEQQIFYIKTCQTLLTFERRVARASRAPNSEERLFHAVGSSGAAAASNNASN
jgi:hypothetical protein